MLNIEYMDDTTIIVDVPSGKISTMIYPDDFYEEYVEMVGESNIIVDVLCADGKIMSLYFKESKKRHSKNRGDSHD